MKTNLQVRVRHLVCNAEYEYVLYLGTRTALCYSEINYPNKETAIERAKRFAKKCGVPFNDKIIKHRGC